MEALGFLGILTLVGMVWIAVIAFQNGEIAWGIFSLLCGIVALIYGILHFDEAKIPLILMIIGMVCGTIGRVAMMN